MYDKQQAAKANKANGTNERKTTTTRAITITTTAETRQAPAYNYGQKLYDGTKNDQTGQTGQKDVCLF